MIAALLIALAAPAATYHVRPDGGDATQCTGRTDAPYPGSGSAQDCAWSHPFFALPPGGAPRIAGGDTLAIANASYMMGLGAPGSDACRADWSWDCHAAAVPSGPSPDRPTRIVGAGWDTGCAAKPELWGTERSAFVLDLEKSSNVALQCLEITDHAACIEHHCENGTCQGEVAACNRDKAPYGRWAAVGVHAAASSNVLLRDLDIHGMANRGVLAGGLRDWTVERVSIRANGWAGWDGDIGERSSNAGSLVFRHLEVSWNGCAERWPSDETFACWAQAAGGYGDGFGTARTGGRFVFEDSSFHHNTSDGLDLLYMDGTGSVTVRRVFAGGNAGNQLKASGDVAVADSVLVGDCTALSAERNLRPGDHCRAAGNTLSLALGPQQHARVERSLVQGEGDCTVLAACADSGCADARVDLVGNRLEALPNHWRDDPGTCAVYVQPRFSDLSVALTGNRLRGLRGSLTCFMPGVDCSGNEHADGVARPATGLAALASGTDGDAP
ncbi:MAG TPA: hypothetical protein VFL14_14790 [Xanthomonadales bacterium]|nr:hypothetical protein [Xanthomonadales bacterium]